MRKLFIFDSKLNIDLLGDRIVAAGDEIYLFPLTSNSSLTRKIKEKIHGKNCRIHEAESGQSINLKTEEVRARYIKFIAHLPKKIKKGNRNLKEIFAIDEVVSLWWFSLVAEKNTFKTDTINRLVQLEAIVTLVKETKIEKVLYGVQSGKLKNALARYLQQKKVALEILAIQRPRSLKTLIKESQRFFYWKHLASLLSNFWSFSIRRLRIKSKIGARKQIPVDKDQILLVTYFPYFDGKSAEEGVFKNKFYSGLDENLTEKGKKVTWLALYVPNNTLSLAKALEYGRAFIRNGSPIFFVEEFVSFIVQVKCLFMVFFTGLRFLRLEKDIAKYHDFGEYDIYPLMVEDWYASFVGSTSFTGLLYYYAFQTMFQKIRANKCLYFLEMHAWEKALIYANQKTGHGMETVGYQHATAPRLLLNYFNDESETQEEGVYPIARPDKIICNGRLPMRYLRESGWPSTKLYCVEAIRYNHLKTNCDLSAILKQNIVLVVCSISAQESGALLAVAYEALKDVKDIKIWIKPHPFLNLPELFNIAGIPCESFLFEVVNKPIDEIMPHVKVVVAGGSGVTIEALAFGCHIIVVEVPEWINMSPLRYIKTSLADIVHSPVMLREKVIKVMSSEFDTRKNVEEAEQIVQDFFNLNRESDIPHKFLELLCKS